MIAVLYHDLLNLFLSSPIIIIHIYYTIHICNYIIHHLVGDDIRYEHICTYRYAGKRLQTHVATLLCFAVHIFSTLIDIRTHPYCRTHTHWLSRGGHHHIPIKEKRFNIVRHINFRRLSNFAFHFIFTENCNVCNKHPHTHKKHVSFYSFICKCIIFIRSNISVYLLYAYKLILIRNWNYKQCIHIINSMCGQSHYNDLSCS